LNKLIPPPLGKTGMGVKTTYEQRRYYDVVSFAGKTDIPTIDLRLLPLYGRVSPEGKIVIPNSNRVEILQEQPVLDIVSEMYAELVNRIEYLKLRGILINDQSFTESLSIKSSFEDATEQHSSYMLSLADKFFTEALDAQKMRKIVDFKQFSSYFIESYTKISEQFPLTLKRFLVSKRASAGFSGLFLTFADIDINDDGQKSLLLLDPNYKAFMNEAFRSGFLIDKNSPNRLVVNFNSEFVKEKLMKLGAASTEEYFDKLCIDTDKQDFYAFVVGLYGMYRAFVSNSSNYEKFAFVNGKTYYKVESKEDHGDLKFKDILSTYGHKFFLRAYIITKAIESNSQLSQKDLENLIKNGIMLHDKVSFGEFIRFVESKFDPLSVSSGSKKSITL